jgi:hypothetical protein
LILSYNLFLVEFFANFPFAVFETEVFNFWFMVFWYLFYFLIFIFREKIKKLLNK